MVATNVPVEMDERAEAQLEKLGLRKELEIMLAHATETIPDLQRLRVIFPEYRAEEDDMLVIEAFGPWDVKQMMQINDAYFRWIFKTFPPEVFGYLLLTPHSILGNNEPAQIP